MKVKMKYYQRALTIIAGAAMLNAANASLGTSYATLFPITITPAPHQMYCAPEVLMSGRQGCSIDPYLQGSGFGIVPYFSSLLPRPGGGAGLPQLGSSCFDPLRGVALPGAPSLLAGAYMDPEDQFVISIISSRNQPMVHVETQLKHLRKALPSGLIAVVCGIRGLMSRPGEANAKYSGEIASLVESLQGNNGTAVQEVAESLRDLLRATGPDFLNSSDPSGTVNGLIRRFVKVCQANWDQLKDKLPKFLEGADGSFGTREFQIRYNTPSTYIPELAEFLRITIPGIPQDAATQIAKVSVPLGDPKSWYHNTFQFRDMPEMFQFILCQYGSLGFDLGSDYGLFGTTLQEVSTRWTALRGQTPGTLSLVFAEELARAQHQPSKLDMSFAAPPTDLKTLQTQLSAKDQELANLKEQLAKTQARLDQSAPMSGEPASADQPVPSDKGSTDSEPSDQKDEPDTK
ncbi:MAG: hypothetical protein LBJ92_02865 [Holosporales bacterium]|jgi:hypothetical protein|nr:hypothetical protein [Holosporales bacterium]